MASELLFFDNEPFRHDWIEKYHLPGIVALSRSRSQDNGGLRDVLRFLVRNRPKHCSDAAELGATAVSFSCMKMALSRAFVSQLRVNATGVVTCRDGRKQ